MSKFSDPDFAPFLDDDDYEEYAASMRNVDLAPARRTWSLPHRIPI